MQGNVAYVNEKNWNGKTLYSFKLKDDQTLYTCGMTKPQMSKGDYVTFEGKETNNGRFEVDVRSINVKKAEVVTPQKGYFRDDSKRQETIEWQAARNSAIAAAGVILQAGALKLPAKEADKYAVITMLISELTHKFFKETKTLGVELEIPKVDEVKAEAEQMPEDWE
jgi:hypothetical protein